MFIRLHKKKAQGIFEYALLISLIIAALLAMMVWMKRGVQGRLKTATDDVGEQFSADRTTTDYTTTTNSHSTESLFGGDAPRAQVDSRQTQVRTGQERTPVSSEEVWR